MTEDNQATLDKCGEHMKKLLSQVYLGQITESEFWQGVHEVSIEALLELEVLA